MSALKNQNPYPKPVLHFSNPFELICAVALSAQTTDLAVNKVTEELFALAPTPDAMVKLGEERISQLIKSIGLWRSKARNLVAMSRILVERFSGFVPDNYEELVSLPGVGSKTALVVLNLAFGHPTVAVDTHIFRVCSRTGFCLGKNAKDVQDKLPSLIDPKFLKDAHHYLLLHGRHVCTARNPKCENCVISEFCKASDSVKLAKTDKSKKS